MRFAWDERKNWANRTNHSLDFRDAVALFTSNAVVDVDDREDYGEIRLMRFGYLGTVPVVVVYTEIDDQTVRIISFRKATRSEARDTDAALLQRHGAAKGDD